MLHRILDASNSRRATVLALAFAIVGPVLPCAAAEPDDNAANVFAAPLTLGARRQLARRIGAHTVEVVREIPAAAGISWPPTRRVLARGWWIGPSRVLTAAPVVLGHPMGANDIIEVASPARSGSATLTFVDTSLGLAVLDVHTPPIPWAVAPLAEMSAGSRIYAAPPDGAGLLVADVAGLGEGEFAYFWRVEGDHLPEGTPVHAGNGAVVGLVGRVDPADFRVSYVLSGEPLRALFARRSEWQL